MKTNFKSSLIAKVVLVLGFSFSSVAATAAQHGPFGLGIMLFGPTGITANYLLGSDNSLDAAFAWGTQPGSTIYGHSTYLWRFPNDLKLGSQALPWYAGIGGRFLTETKDTNKKDSGRTFLGVRTSAGISYELPKIPLEFFGEAGLTLDLVPATAAGFTVGLGGRFYF